MKISKKDFCPSCRQCNCIVVENRDITVEEIIDLFYAGDATIVECLTEVGRNFGRSAEDALIRLIFRAIHKPPASDSCYHLLGRYCFTPLSDLIMRGMA